MRSTAVHLMGYLHSAFWLTVACGLSLAICLSALVWPSRLLAADWRQFRGDDRNGIAPEADSGATAAPPHHWSATENVAWKTALPGRGTSSPIVVAGRVFVTCSSGPRQDHLHVLALDADSGQVVWQRQFLATGRTVCHPMTAVAAPTPASDGRRVVAYFSSNDLVAFDTDGNLLWMRGLTLEHPLSGNDVGMASSPVIAGNTVIVQVECQGDSFAAGFDLSTGAQRWQIPRPKRANWSSPTLLRDATDHGAADHTATDAAGHANDLLLLQSPTGLSAHDPTTGREVWSFKTSCNDIASAVTAHDTIFLPTDGGVQALRVTSGPATSEKAAVAPLWTAAKLNFGAASPIVDAGRVYSVNRAGVLNCGDAGSGTILWQLRLKGAIWGSPAIAGGHMYLVNKDGVGLVVRLPRKERDSKELDSKEHESGELIGEGAIDEPVLASPAIADGALYIRSDRHLWKIAAHGRH
jgi:outer membrane protein assembly factor BamB